MGRRRLDRHVAPRRLPAGRRRMDGRQHRLRGRVRAAEVGAGASSDAAHVERGGRRAGVGEGQPCRAAGGNRAGRGHHVHARPPWSDEHRRNRHDPTDEQGIGWQTIRRERIGEQKSTSKGSTGGGSPGTGARSASGEDQPREPASDRDRPGGRPSASRGSSQRVGQRTGAPSGAASGARDSVAGRSRDARQCASSSWANAEGARDLDQRRTRGDSGVADIVEIAAARRGAASPCGQRQTGTRARTDAPQGVLALAAEFRRPIWER